MYTVNSRYESSTKFKSKSMKAKVVLTQPDYVECLSPGKANLLSLWRSRIEKNNMQRERYEQWLSNHRFDLPFNQRLRRQNEIAREKFMKSVERKQASAKEEKLQD